MALDMKRKHDVKKAKQIEREKQKKIDSRNRAWSKAGVSKREVLEIIHSFNSLDEDLTGEIDPREFFALPAFSSFASESANGNPCSVPLIEMDLEQSHRKSFWP